MMSVGFTPQFAMQMADQFVRQNEQPGDVNPNAPTPSGTLIGSWTLQEWRDLRDNLEGSRNNMLADLARKAGLSGDVTLVMQAGNTGVRWFAQPGRTGDPNGFTINIGASTGGDPKDGDPTDGNPIDPNPIDPNPIDPNPVDPVQAQRVKEILQMVDTGALQNEASLRQFINQRFPGITPDEVTSLVTAVHSQRDKLFRAQDQLDIMRRGITGALGQGFVTFSPLAQRALSQSFSDFQNINPITNFFNQQEMGQAFSNFLGGGVPTSQQGLSQALRDILGSVQGFDFDSLSSNQIDLGDPNLANATQFLGFFGDPNSVVSAGMQPFLQSMAPRMRGRIGNVISGIYGDRIASNPTQFTNPQQMMSLFQQMQQAGFF